VTENTKRGARGVILPAATVLGNPAEDTLLPQTVAELTRLGISPREVALDGGFNVGPTSEALAELDPERVFISGRQQPGSRRTQRRLQRYRTGAEGRISHLKRGYGLDRSRLKGDEGQQIWTSWSILAYNGRADRPPPTRPNRLEPPAHLGDPADPSPRPLTPLYEFIRGKQLARWLAAPMCSAVAVSGDEPIGKYS